METNLEKAKRLTKKSLENIKLSTKNIRNGIEVMPVLHGTTPEEIQKYFVKVKKISDFKIWGVGGLVPQMKQSLLLILDTLTYLIE